MEIRMVNYDHLPQVMRIIEDGREFLKENGIPQWQEGYPNEETIKNDMLNNRSFGLFKDEELVATAALITGGEVSYDVIDGKWLINTTTDYLTVHRLAISRKVRGHHLSQSVFALFESVAQEIGCVSIRMDTHIQNKIMRHVLEKNQFTECGIIYLSDVSDREKSKRIGYEKRV